MNPKRKGASATMFVPIALSSNLFVDELAEARKENQYATFFQALVYLNILVAVSAASKGQLTTGKRASLINALQEVDLNPYRDVLSRIAQAAWRIGDTVQEVELFKMLKLKRGNTQRQLPPTIATYRSVCLKLEPTLMEFMRENSLTLVFDAVDPQAKAYAIDTAHTVGGLVRWLSGLRSKGLIRFMVAMPENLETLCYKNAIHFPAGDLFHSIKLSETDKEDMVSQRIKAALHIEGTLDSKKWLKTTFDQDFSILKKYTFGRPRELIRIIRCGLAECLSNYADGDLRRCFRGGDSNTRRLPSIP